jgi:hypothetical protein
MNVFKKSDLPEAAMPYHSLDDNSMDSKARHSLDSKISNFTYDIAWTTQSGLKMRFHVRHSLDDIVWTEKLEIPYTT